MIYRYEFPEQFTELEQTDFSRYSGNIVLWGAGKLGSIVAHVLKQKGIEARAFVDILPAKQGTEFCCLKIISPEEFLRSYSDAVLIITTIGRDDVSQWLTEHSFTNWYDAWPLLLEFDFGDYGEQNQMYMVRMIDYYFRIMVRSLNLKRKHFADRLRVMVTSQCSLRCKECCTFVPYVKHPRNDDWEQTVSDIKTFLDAAKSVQEVELLGGEPLLHPCLSKIVTALKNEPRIDQISVITNGTILPESALIEALKADSRTIFRISSYGNLSSRIDDIVPLLQHNGIRYEIIDYKTWYKNSEIKLLNETDAELRKKFNRCMEGCGMVSWRGRLFCCLTLPFLVEEGIFPEANDNFYDMRRKDLDHQQLIDEIRDYIDRSNTDQYVDACRYCTGKSTANFEQPVSVAEQAKGLLEMPVPQINEKQ